MSFAYEQFCFILLSLQYTLYGCAIVCLSVCLCLMRYITEIFTTFCITPCLIHTTSTQNRDAKCCYFTWENEPNELRLQYGTLQTSATSHTRAWRSGSNHANRLISGAALMPFVVLFTTFILIQYSLIIMLPVIRFCVIVVWVIKMVHCMFTSR